MIGIQVAWLFGKLLFLYSLAFILSLSLFFYFSGQVLPPHRILKFPIKWGGLGLGNVEIEGGQRLGGNFYIGESTESIAESQRGIYPNVPYDISLLLKYPDRPEINELGNLRIKMKLIRLDGSEAGNFEIIRSLRYERKMLKFFRELIWIPISIWSKEGSDRIERISLIDRLVDLETKFGNEGKKKNYFIKERENNRIVRVEISISPFPPLHSSHLEILANLSKLQNLFYYWRIPVAILIISSLTFILWFLINIYATIEIIKIILKVLKASELEQAEFKAFDEDEEEDNSVDFLAQFVPPTEESVESFIGDLRHRKKHQITRNDSSDLDLDDEDQNVPN